MKDLQTLGIAGIAQVVRALTRKVKGPWYEPMSSKYFSLTLKNCL